MSAGIRDLHSKKTLLTGASRGLGVAIAEALAGQGAELILVARDAARLEDVARDCKSKGAKVRVVSADVTKREDRERLLQEAGPVDVLVNNAGVERTYRLTDQTEQEVRDQLETNLLAPIELSRLVLPGMKSRGAGVIVNVSSMSGKSPTPFNSVYAATKHGLNGFTSSLAIELDGTGVHAGVVCPSFVAGAGMWASTGLKAPSMLREVPLEKVVDAVLAVIRGAPEVLVTPNPVRPLLALCELFPGIEARAMRAMGVLRVLEQRADARRA